MKILEYPIDFALPAYIEIVNYKLKSIVGIYHYAHYPYVTENTVAIFRVKWK